MGADPLIGTVLHDSHKVVRLIGQGGMGSVYEAVHSRLRQKRFAVKVLQAKMASNDVIYARFQREAEIATSLGHPHIIDVSDFYETDDGRPCMVMEYLEGEDLGAVLEETKKLGRDVAIKLVEQVGSALQAVHDKGIVHRDLKPANIFLVGPVKDEIAKGTFRVKVLDFGISKMLDPDSVYTNLTSDRAVMGTPHYMSPEQGEGVTKDVDHRTDVFALGTICYQVLSGTRPFNAPSLPGVIYKICHADPPPISSHDSDLPDEVHQVILKALPKKREDRYQRVEDFVQDLKEALSAPPKKTPIEAPKEEARQDPNTTLVAGIDEVLAGESIEEPRAGNAGESDMTTTLSGSAAEASVHELPAQPEKNRLPLFIGLGVAAVILAVGGVYIALQGSQDVRVVATTTGETAKQKIPVEPNKVAVPEKKQAPSEPTAKKKEPASAANNKTEAPPPSPTLPASEKTAEKSASKPAFAAASSPGVAPPSTPAGPKPTPAIKKIRIRFRLKPADAVVHINGKLHGRKPLMLRMGNRGYKVSVSANGYESKTVRLTAQASRTLKVALKKKPEPKPKPIPKPKPASKTKLITDL